MTAHSPKLEMEKLIDDPSIRVIVCCGSGGVGKTTTAAAVALAAAERGRNVVVLTIDPARRLAQSMGLTSLDNTPRPVVDIDDSAGGSLDAMMLDMKRTFDEIVIAHSEPERAQQILENPFYDALSSSFAGTQEYMAMEKLGQLRADPDKDWDLIVVDTPPSRSALDFLDAPKRLGSFLDGRLMRVLAAPAKGAGKISMKVMNAGFGVFTGILDRILGAQVLSDVQTFVASFETLFGDFRARADQTFAQLQAPDTRFLVVAAPERDALREASYFVGRLAGEQMPLAGLVLNRVLDPLASNTGSGDAAANPRAADAEVLSAEEALVLADRMTAPDQATTAGMLRMHAARMAESERQRRLAHGFEAAHPSVPVIEVPWLSEDVHDLDGLRQIGSALGV